MINSADGWEYCDNDERKIGFLLMGFEAIDYNAVAKHLDSDESFTYVPKLAALQMGAALASMNSIEDKITLESITKCIFVPSSFSKIFNYLNRINRITRIAYIKYFKKWVNNYKADINKNLFNMTYHIACTYEVGDYVRALFKEDTEYITSLSNNLMSIVLITKGNVNHFFGVSKKGLEFDDSVATVYLDGFLSRLRELYGIKEQPTGGDAVKLVKSSTKTSEDMKKELYRYLKLVYDKWIPAMGKKSWEFETFFPDLSGDTSLIQEGGDGHLFHFIDSFYNKIGDKLLINPMKLCTKISAVLQANDVNTMMLGFMADIYSQNKCMMMCLQNFQDFGTEEDAMGVMFKPIPYREMKKPHKHPDFLHPLAQPVYHQGVDDFSDAIDQHTPSQNNEGQYCTLHGFYEDEDTDNQQNDRSYPKESTDRTETAGGYQDDQLVDAA